MCVPYFHDTNVFQIRNEPLIKEVQIQSRKETVFEMLARKKQQRAMKKLERKLNNK